MVIVPPKEELMTMGMNKMNLKNEPGGQETNPFPARITHKTFVVFLEDCGNDSYSIKVTVEQ